MPNKNPAAVALRAIKSEKRAQASRENGKKGGAPRLREQLDSALKQRDGLLVALNDLVDDLKARWDMNDPRTNPGIKQYVQQAEAAIAEASAAARTT